ncbi:hypothetical protein [Plantactinospora sonchi]|uniref:Glycosyltransferase RgtA/B/C/D-like domain-containing protein n=1 Tax=Plantactinospora sonchi TaxID=1544735 RepID=A0ABU7RLX3_9ACTN
MAHEVVAGPVRPSNGPTGSETRAERRRGPRRRQLPRMPFGVGTYLLVQAVLLFWWAARYPGLFSPDSLDHVWQATTGNWNTHHPVAYTGLVWLSVQLTGGVGALTLAQGFGLAAGLTYAVTGLRRIGGPAWGWATAAVAVVLLPPVGTFVVCVWKDVPFVICHVFLLGTLARLVDRRRTTGGTAPPRGLLGALLVELTLVCLFRQNGFLVAVIVTGLVAVLVRGTALRVLLAGVLAATIALLANWALLPALGVRDSGSIVAYESFLADLAVGYDAGPQDFPAADTALMATVAPLTHWRNSANCYTVDPTVYSPDFDRQAATTRRTELLAAWWRLVRRAPGTVLEARLCRASVAWRPTPAGMLTGNPTAWALPIYLERDPRFHAAEVRTVAFSQPVSERAARLADTLTNRVSGPEWLLWRGATWAYLAYLFVGLLAWQRRERAVLVLAALSLGNQLSVMVVNNAQAARYMAAPLVLGILLVPLLAAGPPRQRSALADPHPDSGTDPTPPLQVSNLTITPASATDAPPDDWFWSSERFGPGR